MKLRAIGYGGALLLSGLAVTPNVCRAVGTCGRACLEGFVNQYLGALAAQDTSKLPRWRLLNAVRARS
jgi:hypothetical protein